MDRLKPEPRSENSSTAWKSLARFSRVRVWIVGHEEVAESPYVRAPDASAELVQVR